MEWWIVDSNMIAMYGPFASLNDARAEASQIVRGPVYVAQVLPTGHMQTASGTKLFRYDWDPGTHETGESPL